MITIAEYIIQKQHKFPESRGELRSLFGVIQLAEKVVNGEINKAGLVSFIGVTSQENVQGV